MLNEQTIVKWDKNAETDLRSGLTKAQVKERQTIYGPNRLREGKKKSVLKLFWEQLNDPLIYILMAAIAISLFLGEAGESMIIAAVIILNAVVGVIQEGKAIKAIEALQQLSSPKALVKRDGREMEIPGSELVPGDLIFLEAGRQVPADGRLLTASGLQIDEAALTGESVAVDKEVLGQKKEERVYDRGTGKAETVSSEEEKLHAAEVLGDQKHLVFMTTMVTAGHGEAIVTETGMQTQIGKIAGMISESREELTPLQKRLADLGKNLKPCGSRHLCIPVRGSRIAETGYRRNAAYSNFPGCCGGSGGTCCNCDGGACLKRFKNGACRNDRAQAPIGRNLRGGGCGLLGQDRDADM